MPKFAIAASKNAAKSSAKKESRAKRASDELYNARRRMTREAARLEKRGETEAARKLREKAAGYRVENFGKGMKRGTKESSAQIEKFAQKATRESVGLTKSGKSREKIARAMLRGNAGSQFMAATKELWHRPGEKLPVSERYNRIIQGLNATDLLDAIMQMEQVMGKSLFEAGNVRPNERYDVLAVRKGMLYVSNL